jgi:hypothetical protein
MRFLLYSIKLRLHIYMNVCLGHNIIRRTPSRLPVLSILSTCPNTVLLDGN